MKLSKRIFVFLLVALIHLNAFASATVYEDIDDCEYKEAIDLLVALNIIQGYKDKTFRPDNIITRAEFATALARISNVSMDTQALQTKNMFPDVPDWHWAASSIYAMTEMKILYGYEDGNFGTEDEVLYEQAIQAVVRLLGYTDYDEKVGGYEFGYFSIASEKGIIKNLHKLIGTPVTRGAMAQILYNAFDVEVLEKVYYKDSIKLITTKDKTLLTEIMRIYKVKGQITSDLYTRLDGDRKSAKDEVEIDQVPYKIGQANVDNLIGYQVTAYYREEKDGDRVLIYIEPDGKNDVMVIDANKIEGFRDYTYQYSDDKGFVREAKISRAADIIYNGIRCQNDKVNFHPASGNITLIDYDKNSEYDVVKIISYENNIVQRYDANSKTIYMKYSHDEIDINSNIEYTIRNTKQEHIKLEDLREWDVLSIAKSVQADFLSIIVSKDLAEGSVSEISGSETDKDIKVTIGGKEYEMAENYYASDQKEIGINDSAVFFLDWEGKIAAVKETVVETDYKFAYLMDADEFKAGMEKRARFKLFTSEGKIIYPNGALKIEIDNVKMKDSGEIIGALSNAGAVTPQLIRFKTNDSDEINYIDTPKLNIENGESENSLTQMYPVNAGESGTLPFKSTLKSFGGKFSVNAKTLAFYVPRPENTSEHSDKNYKIKQISAFSDNSEPVVSGYTINKNASIAQVVIEHPKTIGGTSVDPKEPVALVKQINIGLDEQDTRVKKLSALKSGKEVFAFAEINEDGSTLIDAFDTGDAVRYTVDSNNIITAVQLIYDVSENVFNDVAGNKEFPPHFSYTNSRVALGSVYSIEDTNIKIIVGRETDGGNLIDIENADETYIQNYINNINHIEHYTIDLFKTYVYDHLKRKNQVSMGTIQDIKDYVNYNSNYSRVLIQTSTGNPMALIIYK